MRKCRYFVKSHIILTMEHRVSSLWFYSCDVSVSLLLFYCWDISIFSFCHKTGSYFQNIDKIFQGLIYDHIKIPIPNFKSLCHLVRSTDSFKINRGYIAKNFQKQEIAFLGIHSRIPHAKNQPPNDKTVTCRERADGHTNRQRYNK